MSKVTLSHLASLTNQASAVSQINANSDAVVTAMEKTLSRDGTTPNTMSASLDMNSNRIVNLPVPVSNTDAARKIDVRNAVIGVVDSPIFTGVVEADGFLTTGNTTTSTLTTTGSGHIEGNLTVDGTLFVTSTVSNVMIAGIGDGQSLEAPFLPSVSGPITGLYTAAGGFHPSCFSDVTNISSFVQRHVQASSIAPMVASSGVGEPMGFGLGYSILQNSIVKRMYYFSKAEGGYMFDNLATGQPFWSDYMSALEGLATQDSSYTILPFVYLNHGESEVLDFSPGGVEGGGWLPISFSQRVSQLQLWLDIHQKQFNIAFGRVLPLSFFICPKNDTNFGSTVLSDMRNLQNADLNFATTTGNVYMLPPQYLMQTLWSNGDGVHTTGPGRRIAGEMDGKIIADVLLHRVPRTPLYFTSASRVGKVITATASTYLDLDTTILSQGAYASQLYGINFLDPNTTILKPSMITISGRTATITLPSTPSGAGTLVVASWKNNDDYPRCNLCAADAFGNKITIGTSSDILGFSYTFYDYMVPHTLGSV